MALDEKDLAQINALFGAELDKKLAVALPAHIAPLATKLTGFEEFKDKQLPGMIDRIAGEHVKKVAPAKPAEGGEGGGKDSLAKVREEYEAKLTEANSKITSLTTSHEQLVGNLTKAEVKTTVLAALGEIFIDKTEALDWLMPKVQRNADGSLFVPGKTKIPGTDITNDTKLTLEQAVEQLAGTKKHWLKATLGGGGTGAGGESKKTDFTVRPTYQQLMDPRNAELLKQWSEHDPNYVAQIQTDHINKMRSDNAANVAKMRQL